MGRGASQAHGTRPATPPSPKPSRPFPSQPNPPVRCWITPTRGTPGPGDGVETVRLSPTCPRLTVPVSPFTAQTRAQLPTASTAEQLATAVWRNSAPNYSNYLHSWHKTAAQLRTAQSSPNLAPTTRRNLNLLSLSLTNGVVSPSPAYKK